MPSSADPPPSVPSRQVLVAMTLLGVDWGARRIGLAIKPAGQDWVLPRAVLAVRNEADGVAALRLAIAETGAQGVIVGLPANPDPLMTQTVKRFCRKVRRGTEGVRWFFVDETLTSRAADSISLDKPSRRPTDDLAASLILETFLDSCP